MLHTLVFACAALLSAPSAVEPPMKLDLRINKAYVVLGEPLLMDTCITNLGMSSVNSLDWGGNVNPGVWYHIAYENNDFDDFSMIKSFWCEKPNINFDFYMDRQGIGHVKIGEAIRRIDLLLLGPPGRYRVKAVLRGVDKQLWESNVCSFEVLPLEGNDPIAELVDSEGAIDIGRFVYGAYDRLPEVNSIRLSGYSPHELLAAVLSKTPESAFIEPLMFALADREAWRGRDKVCVSSFKETVAHFRQKFPDSWLMPFLAADMCFLSKANEQVGLDEALDMARPYLNAQPPYAALWFYSEATLKEARAELLRRKASKQAGGALQTPTPGRNP